MAHDTSQVPFEHKKPEAQSASAEQWAGGVVRLAITVPPGTFLGVGGVLMTLGEQKLPEPLMVQVSVLAQSASE